ncbi:MAG: hypothetical protein ACLUBL_02025 [Fusobacterium sp.]|uniref:hypothetical protein n=1 Tax=Fusobacterium sp. TaxID=68766 RepID=UPI003992046C
MDLKKIKQNSNGIFYNFKENDKILAKKYFECHNCYFYKNGCAPSEEIQKCMYHNIHYVILSEIEYLLLSDDSYALNI